jgi:hypothetical protein
MLKCSVCNSAFIGPDEDGDLICMMCGRLVQVHTGPPRIAYEMLRRVRYASFLSNNVALQKLQSDVQSR